MSVAVADDEELDEAEKRLGVSVTGIVLVVDDLLHRPPGADPKRLQLDLNDGDAVDQEHDVVAVMAVVRIDAELIDDLEGVLAPVLDVDEGVVERRAVVADERFPVRSVRAAVDVRGDDLVEESLELAVGELTRFRASNFSLKFASSVARSRMSGRYSYLRSRSFVTSASSSRRSGVIIAIAGTQSFWICRKRPAVRFEMRMRAEAGLVQRMEGTILLRIVVHYFSFPDLLERLSTWPMSKTFNRSHSSPPSLPQAIVKADGVAASDNAYSRKLIAPEILEARWRELGVAHGVLDVLVTEVVLD